MMKFEHNERKTFSLQETLLLCGCRNGLPNILKWNKKPWKQSNMFLSKFEKDTRETQTFRLVKVKEISLRLT